MHHLLSELHSLPQQNKLSTCSKARTLNPFLTQCRTLHNKHFAMPATLLLMKNHQKPQESGLSIFTDLSASKKISSSANSDLPEKDQRVLQKNLESVSFQTREQLLPTQPILDPSKHAATLESHIPHPTEN